MEQFIAQHADCVVGVLEGFDRMLFRGTMRSLLYVDGMAAFLATHRVLLKHWSSFVNGLSMRLKDHAAAVAAKAGRPLRYLASSRVSKESIAQQIARDDGVTDGLVCVLTCVEPCQTYCVRRDRARRELVLEGSERKCLHVYFYWMDRQFGLMHARLQTWAPFTMQVCLNGREYLARRLTKAGIGFEQRDNCLARVDDLPRAQAMLDDLEKRDWPRLLNAIARRCNPLLKDERLRMRDYYWGIRQAEYATDVMFRDDASLARAYPPLVRHAMQAFSCEDVLRFLGKKLDGHFKGQVRCEQRRRPEGVRVKHWVDENSIKMYDKQGCVLRIETTINNPRRFRVRRWGTLHGQRVKTWLPLRQSVADIARRAEICRAANHRYLAALAAAGRCEPVRQVLDPVARSIVRDGRSYRCIRPISPQDAAVFQILMRGEHLLAGFRNRDVRAALDAHADADPHRLRRVSGQTSRLLRLLRAHGLIAKIPTTHRYRVTDRGRQVMAISLQIRDADSAKLAA